MFIIIPVTLIAISIIGIAVIIWRKVPYLKKLDIESMASNGSSSNWQEFFGDMVPEIGGQRHKLKEFKDLWFAELEKFVRKTRLLSLKIDHLSGRLIGRIRRVNRQRPAITTNGVGANIDEMFAVKEKPKSVEDKPLDMTELKQKEQGLIIKIAKDPKNTSLYEELGDVYVGMKNWKDAEESIKAAIELSPDNEELKKKLSSILENSNS